MNSGLVLGFGVLLVVEGGKLQGALSWTMPHQLRPSNFGMPMPPALNSLPQAPLMDI
jgi:hypothetical protein